MCSHTGVKNKKMLLEPLNTPSIAMAHQETNSQIINQGKSYK